MTIETGPPPTNGKRTAAAAASVEVRVNGVRLHCLTAGQGPLVILLHGFPDISWVWRFQIPALASAGFRVVAPDLRGFGRSEKPRSIAAYDLDHVTGDIAALPQAFGERQAAGIVGHDLGGVVAWNLGARYPEAAARLAIINAPHPTAFLRALASSDQLLRSSYIGLFLLPIIPEALLGANSAARLLGIVRRGVRRRNALTTDDLDRYRAAWTQPGAITTALAHYRAAARRMLNPRRRLALPRAALPTLVLWGDRDPFLVTRLTEGLDRWAPAIRLVRRPDAGHWVQLDEPNNVNAELVAWFGSSTRS